MVDDKEKKRLRKIPKKKSVNQRILEKQESLEKKFKENTKEIEDSIETCKKDIVDVAKILDVHLSRYEKKAEKLSEIMENAEATLSNVLLAIRQNESYQAWYPAQFGYKEMKVTGEHPAVLERKKRSKAKR